MTRVNHSTCIDVCIEKTRSGTALPYSIQFNKVSSCIEPRHVNLEVAGSSPALVKFSLFIQIYLKMYSVRFPCCLLHDTCIILCTCIP